MDDKQPEPVNEPADNNTESLPGTKNTTNAKAADGATQTALSEAARLRLQKLPPFHPSMSDDDFFRMLIQFLSVFGVSLRAVPHIQGRPVPLRLLFMLVASNGGYERVPSSVITIIINTDRLTNNNCGRGWMKSWVFRWPRLPP